MRRHHRRYTEKPDADEGYHICLEVPLTVARAGRAAIQAFTEGVPMDADSPLARFTMELVDQVESAERDFAEESREYEEEREQQGKVAKIAEKIGLAAENVGTWLLAVWKGEIDATPAQVAAAVALRDLAE